MGTDWSRQVLPEGSAPSPQAPPSPPAVSKPAPPLPPATPKPAPPSPPPAAPKPAPPTLPPNLPLPSPGVWPKLGPWPLPSPKLPAAGPKLPAAGPKYPIPGPKMPPTPGPRSPFAPPFKALQSAPAPPRPPPPPAAPPGAAEPPGAAAAAALSRLNELRARHGAPALGWDAGLAKAAEAAAAACGGFHLRPPGAGETLARGFKDLPSAVDGWYARGDAYDWGRPGPAAGTAPFAQVVWAGTRRVGCAQSDGCARPFYACTYEPATGVPPFRQPSWALLGLGLGAGALPASTARSPSWIQTRRMKIAHRLKENTNSQRIVASASVSALPLAHPHPHVSVLPSPLVRRRPHRLGAKRSARNRRRPPAGTAAARRARRRARRAQCA
jgi:hypothetical protein